MLLKEQKQQQYVKYTRMEDLNNEYCSDGLLWVWFSDDVVTMLLGYFPNSTIIMVINRGNM